MLVCFLNTKSLKPWTSQHAGTRRREVLSSKAITRANAAIIIVVVLVAIAAGAYIVGTPQPTAPSTTQASTAVPAFKDTLIVGTTDSVGSTIDPADAYDNLGWTIIMNTGSPLVAVRPGSIGGPSDVLPALATSWSVSPDGLAYTFNLRQGVKFDDGREFNATDVVYTFDRNVWVLALPDGPQISIGYNTIIKSVNATSTYQVVFHLFQPFAPFLSLMATSGGSYIVNYKYAPIDKRVDYVDGNVRASSPNDLGPYVLTKWVRIAGKDRELDLDVNPNYWNLSNGYPRTPHIIFKMYSDPTALALAIQAGEVDMAFRQLRTTDIKQMMSNDQLKVWSGVGTQSWVFNMYLQEKKPPLDNPDIRRAIAASIDRPTIASTVFGGLVSPLYSEIPPGLAGHIDAFKALGDANYTYTRSVLAKYGYNENNKLVVEFWYESSSHYQQSPDLAAVIKSSLEGSGVIQVNLKSTDWPTFRQNYKNRVMQLYYMGWFPDYVDPDDYTYPMYNSAANAWSATDYKNPQMDALTDQARATTDPATRDQLYAQIQMLGVQDCPIIPLFTWSPAAVTKTSVGGVIIDATSIMRYWLIYVVASGSAPASSQIQSYWMLAVILGRFRA